MLNKAIIAAAMLTALSFNAAQAADGTINFTGKIIAATCDVNGGGGPITLAVPMGEYGAASFAAAGATAGRGDIGIDLTACDTAITKAKVLFEGTADVANPTLIKLDNGTNAATGVGIGLFEADGSTPIKINQSSGEQPVSSNAANLKYVARYVSTVAPAAITEGDANATATFTIQYP